MSAAMNAQQREAVYCRNNAVIAAGAGSGKTTVLANRFLRLITCEGVPVEKILCLTFTKKATAEMYHRIYTGLTSLAADTGADSLVQRLAAHAAANFYLANIQTLDAYCAKVVRAAAPRYGIRPDFSGDARTAAALVAREALPFVISNRAHPALKTLYRIKKTDEIARVYFAEAVSKYDALGDPADFTGDLQKQMRHIAGADVWDAHRSPAAACLEQLAEASPQAGGVTLEPLTVSAGELAAYFDDLLNHDEYDCIAAAAASDTYKKLLRELTMLCALARLNLTTVPKDARDALRELRAQFPCLSALLVFCTEAAFMLSLSRLQTRFQQHITEQKRRNGILSFQDTASLARKALLEQKDLRQSEKNAFQAVIIDEFQDNNALQKDLLFLIAEKPCLSDDGIPPPEALAENKLFFVGDQKQSIYKFRGADVSVFRRLENAFSGGCLSLSVNYRSHSRLIAVFNALFGGQWPETADTAAGDGAAGDGARPQVFVPSAGDVPLYEAVYEPLLAGRADGPPPSSPPPEGIPPEGTFTVCLLPAPSARGGSAGGDDSGEDDDGEEAAVEKEAAFVAQKIAGLIAGGRRPDDIAILTRAHTNEYIYEKHLRAAAVPYKNENRAGGLAIEPVHDLLCALRLAVYPMDTLNYAAFLRSPFAGLSLPASAALAGHAAAGGGPFGEGALELLDDRDRERFDHGAALYRELCARAASSSIAELLRFLWFDAGYRYEVEWHEQTAASRELYDVLFTLAVKAGSAGVSLAAWTDTVKAAQQTGKFRRLVRDENALDGLDIPVEREQAVSILTIHKSKGLQFPVVFICGAGAAGRSTESDDVSKIAPFGITVNPPLPPVCAAAGTAKIKRNYFFEAGKAEERARNTAELRRLLYVAATRAESLVFVSGVLTCKKDTWEAAQTHGHDLSAIIGAVYAERKAAQDEKAARGELRVFKGDTIIHDNTFLGMLLPALALRAGSGGLVALERIVPAPPPAPAPPPEAGITPEAGVQDFIGRVRGVYEAAALRETPPQPRRYCAVSALPPAAPSAVVTARPDLSGTPPPAGCFAAADAVIEKNAPASAPAEPAPYQVFTAADFGSAAHRALEARLKNEAYRPPPAAALLNAEDEETVMNAAAEAARHFLDSPLGRLAQKAAWRESELPFRMNAKCAANAVGAASAVGAAFGTARFINGVLDLVFQKDGGYCIVDFKTDRACEPERHVQQLALYHAAAQGFLPGAGELFLYYLRTGHVIQVIPAGSYGNAD